MHKICSGQQLTKWQQDCDYYTYCLEMEYIFRIWSPMAWLQILRMSTSSLGQAMQMAPYWIRFPSECASMGVKNDEAWCLRHPLECVIIKLLKVVPSSEARPNQLSKGKLGSVKMFWLQFLICKICKIFWTASWKNGSLVSWIQTSTGSWCWCAIT